MEVLHLSVRDWDWVEHPDVSHRELQHTPITAGEPSSAALHNPNRRIWVGKSQIWAANTVRARTVSAAIASVRSVIASNFTWPRRRATKSTATC